VIRLTPINQPIARRRQEKCRRALAAPRRQKEFRHDQHNPLRAFRKAAFKASRRDAPVVCASCGRQVRRRGRLQRYCSTRCRKRGHYAQKVRRGDFSTPKLSDTALGTTLLQKGSKYNALQRAKTLSSPHILAPAHVLAEEVFNRPCESATSSAGVAIEIGRLRHRALVAP
jgi:hypothetical protein